MGSPVGDEDVGAGAEEPGTDIVPAMPPLVEGPNTKGGKLYRGGVPGNKGGRPSSEIRERFRGILTLAQEEIERRLEEAAHRVQRPTAEQLEMMTKKELIELVVNPPREMDAGELARLTDIAGKYGIGAKHVHSGEDDGPIQFGVVLLPPTDPEGGS